MSELKRSNLIEELSQAWLSLDSSKKMIEPLSILTGNDDEYYQRLVWLLTRPEYIAFFCKVVLNLDILPFQAVIIKNIIKHRFPMVIATRGASKSFLNAVTALIVAVLNPGIKIVVAGAAFRQSRIVHDYMESIWTKAPILRDLYSGGSKQGPSRDIDMCYMRLGDSVVNSVPIGTGEKIRGLRAGFTIAEEFASQSRDIFETVIAGFSSVSTNPVEQAKLASALEKGKEMGLSHDQVLDMLGIVDDGYKNKIVITGTAFYDFNHFAEYWKKWKSIIESKGEKKKLEEIFKGDVPPDFDWRDYCILRLPYDVIPNGFMDQAQLARSKATVHSGIFNMEMGAVFSRDSKGFFKRSIIEQCTGTRNNPVKLLSGDVYFDASTIGNPQKEHIIAVDPAFKRDNFAIVVLELNNDHRRVVHCWTVSEKRHKSLVAKGMIKQDDFYVYCTRKIRELMVRYPTIRLCIDAQGGGTTISEALHNKDHLIGGELPIWPVIDPHKPKSTDGESGLHILEMCEFSNSKWLSEANHGLKMDLENKFLLFPQLDSGLLALSAHEELDENIIDTLEDCVMNIEELKNELAVIEVTVTQSGREHWDTPEVKTGVGRKERLVKDRYSALLMANMATRNIDFQEDTDVYSTIGGFAEISAEKEITTGFIGPSWFTEQMENVY